MIFTKPDLESAESVVYLHAYYPTGDWRILDAKKIRLAKDILDFKDAKEYIVNRYRDTIDELIASDIVLACVPSHKPNNLKPRGIRRLTEKLAVSPNQNRVDGTACLVRHTEVAQRAKGGDRSIETHLNSIRVDNGHLIRGKEVLLLDDVTTSGNSLQACKQLLLQAGAKRVRCLVLSKTTHPTPEVSSE